MTARRRRMRDDLPRQGVAPKTQPCSLEAVKHLAHYFQRAPDQLSEAEIRPSFLSLLHETQGAERT